MDFIETYKTQDIYQEEETGYFISYDKNDRMFSREATLNLVKSDIDILIKCKGE